MASAERDAGPDAAPPPAPAAARPSARVWESARPCVDCCPNSAIARASLRPGTDPPDHRALAAERVHGARWRDARGVLPTKARWHEACQASPRGRRAAPLREKEARGPRDGVRVDPVVPVKVGAGAGLAEGVDAERHVGHAQHACPASPGRGNGRPAPSPPGTSPSRSAAGNSSRTHAGRRPSPPRTRPSTRRRHSA